MLNKGDKMDKLKCKVCGTTKGVDFEGMCKNCYLLSIGCKLDDDFPQEEKNSKKRIINKIADIYNTLAMLSIVFGIIIAVIVSISISSILVGFYIFISFFASWLFLRTFSEIIQLLEDIKNK